MDIIQNLGLGLSVALTFTNVGLCFLGCLIGTLVGVLPGVGPVATIAILLPVTLNFDPTGALIMLAGIYYGAQYGGSTTAILVNIPGEATAVVTALDGHRMAQNGQAGLALGLAAIGSFVAGTIATIVIAALGVPMTKLGLLFGPAEYFSLMIMGLVLAVVLAHGSLLKAVAMIAVGILLSSIGSDIETGRERLTLGFDLLHDGIEFVVLAMGIFGFGEIFKNLADPEARDVVRNRIGRLWPTFGELRENMGAILRGTGIGSVLGVLPGNGAFVGVVSAVTGQPPLVTGKPDPAMHAECVRRTGARRPLVVGDRLDTDIEGARRAGADSLLVLSGVATPADLLAARPDHRPDLLAADATGLLTPHPGVVLGEGGWRCRGWVAEETGGELTLRSTGDGAVPTDGLDGLRALAVAHWSQQPDAGEPAVVRGGDAAAAEALRGWGLTAG